VALVRHVADLGLGDGLDDGGCWGGHGVSCGWSATSTVGVCARRAVSPLREAPWLGRSVADTSIEVSLDAVQRLGQGYAQWGVAPACFIGEALMKRAQRFSVRLYVRLDYLEFVQ